MSYSLAVTRGRSELGSERADALRRASLTAQSGSTQLPACTERELPSSFFASVEAVGLASDVSAATARALAAREVDLGHSFARCPAAPQNMQSPLSNLRFHSSGVSLPSLLSFLAISGLLAFLPFKLDGEFVGWGELPEGEVFLSDLLGALLLPLLLLFPSEVLV